MTPYDVLMDTLAVHWIAQGAGGIVVSVALCHSFDSRNIGVGHVGDRSQAITLAMPPIKTTVFVYISSSNDVLKSLGAFM